MLFFFTLSAVVAQDEKKEPKADTVKKEKPKKVMEKITIKIIKKKPVELQSKSTKTGRTENKRMLKKLDKLKVK